MATGEPCLWSKSACTSYSHKLSIDTFIKSQNRLNPNNVDACQSLKSMIPPAGPGWHPFRRTLRDFYAGSACFWCLLLHVHKPCVSAHNKNPTLYSRCLCDLVMWSPRTIPHTWKRLVGKENQYSSIAHFRNSRSVNSLPDPREPWIE